MTLHAPTPGHHNARRRRPLVLLAALLLALIHAPAGATPSQARPGLPNLTPAAPEPARLPAAALWQGFQDPVLQAYLQAALAQAGDERQARAAAARTGTLYVTARWLQARLAVMHDLRHVLGRQRLLVAAEGPTPQAAAALKRIDQEAAQLDAGLARIGQRCAALVAQLQTENPLPAEMAQDVAAALNGPHAVPHFEPPAHLDGADQVLQAQAALAIGWVHVLAAAP